MTRILNIVDSFSYVNTNCFQHQLQKSLREFSNVETLELNNVLGFRLTGKYDLVVSTLKLRTLYRAASQLRNAIGQTPIVIYDQDPWESWHDEAQFKGAYITISKYLNVKKFAVTTNWWSKFVRRQRLPCEFVKMGVLPEYCTTGTNFLDKKIGVGFVGQLHPYRKQLFDSVGKMGIHITVQPGGKSYQEFLSTLSTFRFYLHAEHVELNAEGEKTNLDCGLWIKDVEAISQGCFSIRNRGSDHESYDLQNTGALLLYDDKREIPFIIDKINQMDKVERQNILNDAVEFIKKQDSWKKTAESLIAI